MQPLRLFPQPGHAARTSPVRHGKRGLSSADDGREPGKSREGGPGTQPPPPHATTMGGLSCWCSEWSHPAADPLKAGGLETAVPPPPPLSRCISMPVDISGGLGAGGSGGVSWGHVAPPRLVHPPCSCTSHLSPVLVLVRPPQPPGSPSQTPATPPVPSLTHHRHPEGSPLRL